MTLLQRMMLTLSLSLVGLWTVTSAWHFVELREQMRHTLDQRLAASARMVAGLMSQIPASAQRPLPEQAISSLVVPGAAGIACQVSSLRGEVLARTQNSPELLQRPVPGLDTQTIGDEQWRVFTHVQDNIVVTTADRVSERRQMLDNVTRSAALPFGLATLGGLLALWIGVHRSLRPVTRLCRAIGYRAPQSLSPLAIDGLPRELSPVVEATNRLLAQVGEALERERRFTSDAAHELRTPLASIKVHVQVAKLRLSDSDRQDEIGTAIAAVEQGVERMTLTLEQLLMLARLDSGHEKLPGASASIANIVRDAVDEAGKASGSHIDVSMPVGDHSVSVPKALATGALRNLLDNALRVSPPDRPPTLTVSRNDDYIEFVVRDYGAGLAPGDIEVMKRRFWRKASSTGSGLGLAIVDSIANHSGGKFSLMGAPDGAGLFARLLLPRKS